MLFSFIFRLSNGNWRMLARRYCLPTASSTFFPRMCLAFWRIGLAVRVYLTIPLPGALPLAESEERARAAVRLIENRSARWMLLRSKAIADTWLPIRVFRAKARRVVVEFSCGNSFLVRQVQTLRWNHENWRAFRLDTLSLSLSLSLSLFLPPLYITTLLHRNNV